LARDITESLDAAVATVAGVPPLTPAPPYVVDPANFDLHVGDYHDEHNIGDVVITRQGDDLYIDCPTLASFGITVAPLLQPISSDILLATIDGVLYDFTFIPAVPGGDSVYMRNRSFVATRQPAAMQAAAAVTYPPAEDVKRWSRSSRLAQVLTPHVRR
jgi:hypothetical protein